MNRRSFLKRLGIIPAALVGAKLVEKLPERVAPVAAPVEIMPQPLPNYLPYSGPVWISPYGGSGTWGGYCPACQYPTITSAAHTHNIGGTITINTVAAGANTANLNGFTIMNIS